MDQVQDYLSNRSILVVDANEKRRMSTLDLLISLGVKLKKVFCAEDYEIAKEMIGIVNPEFVISQYTIPKGNGLDLASEFNHTKSIHSIFIMMAEASLPSIVMEAAEEDVDMFVLSPYSKEYFVKTLTQIIRSKLNPSEYYHRIQNGKKLLNEKSWDNAIDWFNQAIQNNSAPSLAYYYRAQAEINKLLHDLAEQSLRDGLSHNSNHYKCLISLFELLFERGKLGEAYEIVKKLTIFRLNSSRLSKAISLAVKTAHYTDMDKYYEAYEKIDVRDTELTKQISAALVVSSKMLFQRGEMYKAAAYLKKATRSAEGRPNILLEIVTTLAVNGFIPNAKSALAQFPIDLRDTVQYKVACSMIAFFEIGKSDAPFSLLKGEIENGSKEPGCFYWLIAFLQASGKKDQAQHYLTRANEYWPDKRDYFLKALYAVSPKTTLKQSSHEPEKTG